jgi:hypothetical protein
LQLVAVLEVEEGQTSTADVEVVVFSSLTV